MEEYERSLAQADPETSYQGPDPYLSQMKRLRKSIERKDSGELRQVAEAARVSVFHFLCLFLMVINYVIHPPILYNGRAMTYYPIHRSDTKPSPRSITMRVGTKRKARMVVMERVGRQRAQAALIRRSQHRTAIETIGPSDHPF